LNSHLGPRFFFRSPCNVVLFCLLVCFVSSFAQPFLCAIVVVTSFHVSYCYYCANPWCFMLLLLWKPFMSLLLHPPFVLLLLCPLFTLHIIFVVILTLHVHISHYCCCAFLSCFTLPLLPFMYMFLHNVNVPFLCTLCC
jgi:hypothetical protein